MRKLSPAQQKVVDILKNNDAYVVPSIYFNHQKIISRVPIKVEGQTFETYTLEHFTKDTFKVLTRLGYLVKDNDDRNNYMLVNPEIQN